MRKIHKKVLKTYYEQIAAGQKTYELRLADWKCEPGDALILDEIDDETKQPTGRSLRKRVGFVGKTKDFNFWSDEEVEKYGYQVISLIDRNDLWEVSAKALIFNEDKTKVLLSRYYDNKYGMVGGHLDYGETFDHALRREIKEETGVDFSGKISEVGPEIHEYSRKKTSPIHKVAFVFSLTIPESTPVRLEEDNKDIVVALDWVRAPDLLADKFEFFYIDSLKKALKKEKK